MTATAYIDLDALVRLKHQGQGYSFLPRQPITSLLAGQKASRLRGRGLNFEEIRAYLPGDDIRNIDWKVTARMRETHTRVYTEERDRPAFLLVDQRAAMFFGSQRAMKSVVAAELAALGAWRVVDQGDRVGALVFNDTDIVEVRPLRSTQTVMHILDAVVRQNRELRADTEVAPRPEQLNEVLERTCRLAKHDCLVCLISDMDGADNDSKRLMSRLAAHNDVLVALVYDPLETDLPDLGRLVVGDGELQVEIDSGDEKLRRDFADRFRERYETIRSILLQRDVPVLPIETARPPAEQLRKVLGQPRPRRRR